MKSLRYIFTLAIWLCIQTYATNYFRLNSEINNITQIEVNTTYTESSTISPFRNNGKIAGMAISGKVTKQSNDYLVRVLLKDKAGHKHCILELYNMIKDSLSFSFTDYCEETTYLDNIETDSIILIVYNAKLELDNISIVGETRSDSLLTKKAELRKNQIKSIADKINAYNVTNRKFWGAGTTPLALKRYEERMKYLGLDDNENTEGFEYYCSGLFVSGSKTVANTNRSSSCVSQFDWCNRHGKNWITGIRDQGDSGFCFAFTAVAATESMLMLYYNSGDSVILSSDQLARCTYNDPYEAYHNGALAADALEYAKVNGICDNIAFPFVDSDSIPCLRNLIIPNEIVKITDYSSFSYNTEDDIKVKLIDNGPMTSGYLGHAMLLVGYGVVQIGDVIRVNNGIGNTSQNYTVESGDIDYIGKTYWKFKNSYGYDPDITVDGYSYIIFNDLYYMREPYYIVHPYCLINTSYNTIKCEDRDGDGYYFWGLSNRPNYCPDWVPSEPDGDDNDSSKGEMLTNPKGELKPLNLSGEPLTYISGNVTYTTRQSKYSQIIISSGSSLTIKNILNLFGSVTINVFSGGQLIIDGGVITNAAINMSQGSQLRIINGGKLVLRTNTSFEAPEGSVVDIQQGEIIRSNDF